MQAPTPLSPLPLETRTLLPDVVTIRPCALTYTTGSLSLPTMRAPLDLLLTIIPFTARLDSLLANAPYALRLPYLLVKGMMVIDRVPLVILQLKSTPGNLLQ